MGVNLNENLYNRFNLQIDRDEVDWGFRAFLFNKARKALELLWQNSFYHSGNRYYRQYKEAKDVFLEECCYELFLNSSNYKDNDLNFDPDFDVKYLDKFLRIIFQNIGDSFEKFLVKTQIFINIFYKQNIIKKELGEFINEIDQYARNFPVLGVMVKTYKTKAPQILPSTSKYFDKEIIDTLGILDTQQFKLILNDFESGLKLFAKAKTDFQFKDVVEDMYASCDEVVKIVLNDKNKGFKHAVDKIDHQKLGLNGHQKEIFKNLKNWMDEIKHGSKKNIERAEVEMIISMSASFIRFVAIKSTNKIGS